MSKPTLSDAVEARKKGGKKDVEQAKAVATGREEEPTKRLNVNVPESLYDEFKYACKSEGRTMSWVVVQMLKDYVSKGK